MLELGLATKIPGKCAGEVLDRSGSMAGKRLVNALAAAIVATMTRPIRLRQNMISSVPTARPASRPAMATMEKDTSAPTIHADARTTSVARRGLLGSVIDGDLRRASGAHGGRVEDRVDEYRLAAAGWRS